MFPHRHSHDTDTDTDTDTRTVTGPEHREPGSARVSGRDVAHDSYGGMNMGADFFGWLVALSVAALLTGVLGAAVAAVSETAAVSQSDAERSAGTIGIVSAVVLVLVAGVGYYAGGYVAGRMSRFDGARQGLGVWLIGLVVMVLAAATGAVFGREYDVLDRVDLPQLPISDAEASIGGLIAAGALLLVTLLAALAGGKVGRNYHRKVDAAHLA